MNFRQSVMLFEKSQKREKKCTCKLCSKAILPPIFICFNCFHQSVVTPFLGFKQSKLEQIKSIKENIQQKTNLIQAQKYQDYFSLVSRKSKLKILQDKIAELRKKQQELQFIKTSIKQHITSQEQRVKQCTQILNQAKISIQKKQAQSIQIHQGSQSRFQKLKKMKLKHSDDLNILDNLVGIKQYMNNVSLKRVEIASIQEQEEGKIILDSWKILTKDEKVRKLIYWATKILLYKTYVVKQILAITLPYRISIISSGGIGIGSKVMNLIVLPKDEYFEDIFGFLQLDLDYLFSKGGFQEHQTLNISADDLRKLIQNSNGFQSEPKYWRSYISNARLQMIASDKEMCQNMEEQCEEVFQELYEVISIKSSSVEDTEEI